MRLEVLQFDGFEYDLGNIRKIQSHGVLIGEIESFFSQELLVLEDTKHSQGERRLIAAGHSTKKQPMFVVFTMRTSGGQAFLRPISARYCHKKETLAYERLKKNIEK